MGDETRSTGGATILLVAPEPPPYGGMALQAQLLRVLLARDGKSVVFLASNCSFGELLRFLECVPGVRTAARFLFFSLKLCRTAPRVDVIHVLAASWLYFFAVVAPVVLIGKAFGRRIVLNYRGGDADRFFRRFKWSIKPFFHMADVVTAPSEFLVRVIERYFDVPVSIVRNVLDRSAFTYRKRTEIRPRMIVARQLEKIYDVESVLRAFAAVQHRYRDASLVIAGMGREEARLRAIAEDLKLENVAFLGYVAHRDLPRLYDENDIFVNGSRVDNFPGALLEASAAGLVVVSTAAGGIPFMYRDGENALLVQPGNWQALARALEQVLESPQLGAKLAQAGLRVAECCDWESVRETIYKAYGPECLPRTPKFASRAAAPKTHVKAQ
jgi:glycosyltransferase involved in cell wall biosynthesis